MGRYIEHGGRRINQLAAPSANTWTPGHVSRSFVAVMFARSCPGVPAIAFDPVQQVVVGFRDRPGGREKQGVVRSEKSDTCLEGWFVMPGVGRVRNAVLTIALAGAAVFSVGAPTASAQPVERSHDRGTFTCVASM